MATPTLRCSNCHSLLKQKVGPKHLWAAVPFLGYILFAYFNETGFVNEATVLFIAAVVAFTALSRMVELQVVEAHHA